MRVIMELLGHSTINLTMSTYAHVLPEAQEDAVTRLDGLVMGGDQARDEADDIDSP